VVTVPTSELEIAIATPGDWIRLELGWTDAEITAMVEERIAQLPQLDDMRDQAIELLRLVRDGSLQAGIAIAAVMFDLVERVPITASMTVSAIQMPEAADVDSMADELRSGHEPGAHNEAVSVVELPAGRAVRIQKLQEGEASPSGSSTVTFHLQYLVPVAKADTLAAITFATPTVALADSFVPLFAGIASTFELRPVRDGDAAS
jgi:hypothetical protein